jgi:hypothetical protein
MSIDHTVVLLPALSETEAQTAELHAAVDEVAHVLTPDISVRGSTPVILEEPALAVTRRAARCSLSSGRAPRTRLGKHGRAPARRARMVTGSRL